MGCGSDQTGFTNPDGGHGKGNPDAGPSAGGGSNTGGATNTGGSTNAGGSGNAGGTSQGGSGAMSMADSGPVADAATGGTNGNGPDSGTPDAASGGASNPDSGADSGSGACPSGSTRVDGKCLKDNLQACALGTECGSGNCVGGACCKVACNAPGACQKLDGTVCQNGDTCVYGSQADGTADAKCPIDKCSKPATCFSGACAKGDALDCADTNFCTVDACDPTTGCTHTPIDVTQAGNTCDDSNVCTTDTCNPAVGCQHANANGAKAGCNDNNPCTTDICSGGICLSTPLDCSGLTDACNTGVCAAGACKAQPANVNGACAQGLTACDAGGKCNAAGACVSTGSACGARSSSCTPCTTGASCQAGRLCTCTPVVPADLVVGGVCVANADDCATNPCGATGTACHDPTPDGSKKGDFVCTCAAGYSQKAPGAACTDVDECNGANPCMAGTCANTVGSYDCTCAAPLTKIQTATGPECACNLGGTYALIANTTVSYPPISVLGIQTIEGSPAAGLQNVAWALRYNTVDAAKGTVTSQTVGCGGSTPDLCDTAFGFAHAQYQPTPVFGQPAMVTTFPPITTSLAGVVPGGTYTEPPTVAVQGIKLDNPSGAWPACNECVGSNHPTGSLCTCPGGTQFTITNGAQWLNNPDGLGYPGFTTFDVPRGGVLTTAANPPPFNYTEPSVCPRIASPHNQYGYAEFPGFATNNQAFLAYSWHAASRLQSTFQVDTKVAGESISNQCTLTGGITGPDSGHAKTDARVQGCETCSTTGHPNMCTPTGACTQPQYDSYDKIAQNQQILAATFTLAPAPAGVGNLGTVLAMPDGAAKTAAINAACGLVRAAYPAARK